MCRLYLNNSYCEEVVAIADNNPNLWGGGGIMGHPIIAPSNIHNYAFDRVIITLNTYYLLEEKQRTAVQNVFSIIAQLEEMGISDEQIEVCSVKQSASYNEMFEHGSRKLYARTEFLRYFAMHNNIDGEVAECGVFTGDFAAQMNRFFPSKKLYLFDTFSGFDKRDVVLEVENEKLWWESSWLEKYNITDERLVILKCPYRDNIDIRKGYVPETLGGLEDERFAFVNLDMDVYKPTRAALEFFIPRMNKGGIILCHDYVLKYLGIAQAVHEMAEKFKVSLFPIGDNTSIAVMPL
jgi:hypothetical protein